MEIYSIHIKYIHIQKFSNISGNFRSSWLVLKSASLTHNVLLQDGQLYGLWTFCQLQRFSNNWRWQKIQYFSSQFTGNPMHWSFPVVIGLRWRNYFILIAIQKIVPLILISYLINFYTFSICIITSSGYLDVLKIIINRIQ